MTPLSQGMGEDQVYTHNIPLAICWQEALTPAFLCKMLLKTPVPLCVYWKQGIITCENDREICTHI